MTDILERLRSLNADFLHEEAADEIERLREVLCQALLLHDIEQAERPTPNVPAWIEEARALLTEDER